MVIFFPLPPAECSPNSGRNGHWSIKSKARKAYRSDCVNTAIEQGHWNKGIGPKSIRIDVAFYAQRRKVNDGCYRPLDKDNGVAAIKGLIDSLADAGIVKNDSGVEIGSVTLLRTAKQCNGRIGVEVRVTEI